MALCRGLLVLLLQLCVLYVFIIDAQTNIDPYKTLNVPKHATQKEIRKAFKTLALRYHPDRNVASKDPEKMKTIAAAYEILGDEEKRKKYDREQTQQNIFSAHGFRRSATSNSHGIGAQLTTYNYQNLLYNIHDVPWLILAYEDFSQPCKQAMAVFEEACIKLQGVARCAKLNVNKDSALINEFGLRRVPHFIVFYHFEQKTRQSAIAWKGRERTKMYTLIDGVADIFPHKCVILNSEQQMIDFLHSSDSQFDDAHFNRVKAIIFSDARNRHSPHVLLQYLATNFASVIDFAYVHMNTDKPNKLAVANKMAARIGLDAAEIEPPSMYILRAPLIHTRLLQLYQGEQPTLQSLEDMGVYHVSLSSDVNSMQMFVEQYASPLVPKLDGTNFLEQCFFDATLESIEEDKICYVFAVNTEEASLLQSLFMFGQHVLASLAESVQFGWINCAQQTQFCSAMHVTPKADDRVRLVAIRAYHDHYKIFDDDSDGNDGVSRDLMLGDENIHSELVPKVVQWIKILEQEEMVFRDDDASAETVCTENNTENCKPKNIDTQQQDVIWKKGVSFPTKPAKWTDNIDVLGGLGSMFGLVGSGVGAGVSAVSTLVSSLLQIGFVMVIFLFLMPMLRMAR